MKTIKSLAVVVALSVGILHSAEADVVNDNFADAIVLVGDSGTESTSNEAATQETGEANLGANSKCTVWYKWTAVKRGTMTIDTLGSDFDTLIAAYTGTEFGDLSRVALNDDYSGRLSRMQFIAESGVTYFILAGGFSTDTGNLVLNWEFVDGTFEMIVNDGVVTGYRGICPSALTSADWPAGVTNIAERAFYNAPVESVVIPDGVTSISSYAFYYCRSLQSLTIPSTVKKIGDRAFYYCRALSDVTLEEGLTEIGAGAFESCTSLESITIPASVTSISSRYGWRAFGGCTSLDEVVFVGDKDAIDMTVTEAFARTPWLESLDFSLEIKNNRVAGFLGVCPATVIIPEGVTEIGGSAFSAPSVTNLVHVVLPESLDVISDNAFNGCSKLQSIHIPENVWAIYSNAFRGCVSLDDVTFGREDWLDYYDMRYFYGTPFYDTLPFRLYVSWRMKEGWEHERFYIVGYIGKCPDILDIEAIWAADWERQRQRYLDESGYDIGEAPAIEGIEENVFARSGISSVIFPAGLVEIGEAAFDNCTNLTRVVFTGDAPAEIGQAAFKVYAEGFDEWGNWMPYIGPNPNCTVYVPANSTGWGVDIPGEWMGMPIRYSAAGAVKDGVLVSVSLGGDTEYTVPSGVTNIAANAFAGCGDLERVVIPDGVSSIESSAFDGCGKLWAKWFKTLERLSEEGGSPSGATGAVALTVTNVVVHYVATGVPGAAVAPPQSTGIVNVIAEVGAGGTVAIPSEWAAQYPGFEAKFGSDFTAAVTKPTGKRDGAGNAMQVWQDFVAGTDPTKEDDVFTASITFDADGKPVIGWSPVFSDPAEAAKRVYRKFGKVRLQDKDWTPFADGEEENYNFFKVTVEMK